MTKVVKKIIEKYDKIRWEKMAFDPIFKNNFNLKKEYQYIVQNLPLLNKCISCRKLVLL